MNINTGERWVRGKNPFKEGQRKRRRRERKEKAMREPPPPPKKPGAVPELTEKMITYVRSVMLEGKTKREAKKIAGYSDATVPERFPSVRGLIRDIESERKRLQSTVGFTLNDIATRFLTRATDKNIPAAVQTENDKQLVNVLDMNPAKKVNVQSVGLLMEFKDLTSEDLKKARDRILSKGIENDG